MVKEAKHPVQSTKKSFEIIEELLESGPLRIRDLEDQLPFSKSVIHNHLSTLLEEEYVVKEGKTYRLGLKFLNLGGKTRKRHPLYRTGRPKVYELANETGELVNLMTEEYGMGVHLYQASGAEAVNLSTHAGKRLYLHNIALGKSILAHLPGERVREIIDTYGLPKTTENTIDDPQHLFDELDQVRDQGYAVDDEEREKGLRCFAAPILNPQNDVLGAISISTAAKEIGGGMDEQYLDQIQGVATKIELEIKYASPEQI